MIDNNIENDFFILYNNIENDLYTYIDNKKIREYRTPFIVDNTNDEDTYKIMMKYPNIFTIIDGKKMHLDKCFRKEPLLPILEEARRLLVLAMINNRTLVIRLSDSATDFLNTFNDNVIGAILGIIEHDYDDYDYDNDDKRSKIDDIIKFKNEIKLIDNNNNDNNNDDNNDNNDDNNDDDKSSDWRSYDYDYDSKTDSTFVPPWDNHDSISIPDNNGDSFIDINDKRTHNSSSHMTDSHHHHERNKADARVEGGSGSFGATEGLGLYNERPPYHPYSYFPKRVLINGGLKLNNEFWKNRLYRREDLGYGQGKIHHSLYNDQNTIQNKRFNVIITSTHDVESLQSFLFNGRFGLPSIDNFNIHIFNNSNEINNNNDDI